MATEAAPAGDAAGAGNGGQAGDSAQPKDDSSISKLESAIPLLVALLAAAGVSTTADRTAMYRSAPGWSAAAFALTGVAVVLAFIAGAEIIRPRRKTTTRPRAHATPTTRGRVTVTELAAELDEVERKVRELSSGVETHQHASGRHRKISSFLFGAPSRRRQYRFTVYSALSLGAAFVSIAIAVVASPADAPRVDTSVVGPPLTLRTHVTASGISAGDVLGIVVLPRRARPCAEPTPVAGSPGHFTPPWDGTPAAAPAPSALPIVCATATAAAPVPATPSIAPTPVATPTAAPTTTPTTGGRGTGSPSATSPSPTSAPTQPFSLSPANVLGWRVLGPKSNGNIDVTFDVQLANLTDDYVGIYACIVNPHDANPTSIISTAFAGARCAVSEEFIPGAPDPTGTESPSPSPSASSS